MKPRVAIIGAGMAGISLAKLLNDKYDVTVFERSRSVGGRFAHRYLSGQSFDHGVQFFRIFTQTFRDFLQTAHDAGLIQPWSVRFAEIDCNRVERTLDWTIDSNHWVASPYAAALPEFLSQSLHVQADYAVQSMQRRSDGWYLIGENEQAGPFDWCITATPPANAIAIMNNNIGYRDQLLSKSLLPCYALMLTLNETLDTDWQVALVKNSALSWISHNDSKPGRPASPGLVCLAANQWAKTHFGQSLEIIQSNLLTALESIIPGVSSCVDDSYCHRWSYANIAKQHGPKYLIDTDNQVASVGDWCIQGRVEAAFLSAHALSEELLKNV